MKIEAESYEEAVRMAYDGDLPDGEYVEGSFTVNDERPDNDERNLVSKT